MLAVETLAKIAHSGEQKEALQKKDAGTFRVLKEEDARTFMVLQEEAATAFMVGFLSISWRFNVDIIVESTIEMYSDLSNNFYTVLKQLKAAASQSWLADLNVSVPVMIPCCYPSCPCVACTSIDVWSSCFRS